VDRLQEMAAASVAPRGGGGGHGESRPALVQFVRGGILPAVVAAQPGAAPGARHWLEQRLVEQGLSIEQLVQLESQNQAADQVSVSHSIASLRFLSAMDWKEFVETLSLVEATLRSDPVGVYRRMDFATRDRYRHAVETSPGTASSRKRRWPNSPFNWPPIAPAQNGREARTAHVGYYLIDKGQPLLERAGRCTGPGAPSANEASTGFR
jgi:hypothetical protein